MPVFVMWRLRIKFILRVTMDVLRCIKVGHLGYRLYPGVISLKGMDSSQIDIMHVEHGVERDAVVAD
ncbi:MAG: hypothetical protein MI864_21460 [Pseudomonadales bacterium]|nr:hypothetical protein [Pseudomonadales bacterium]